MHLWWFRNMPAHSRWRLNNSSQVIALIRCHLVNQAWKLVELEVGALRERACLISCNGNSITYRCNIFTSYQQSTLRVFHWNLKLSSFWFELAVGKYVGHVWLSSAVNVPRRATCRGRRCVAVRRREPPPSIDCFTVTTRLATSLNGSTRAFHIHKSISLWKLYDHLLPMKFLLSIPSTYLLVVNFASQFSILPPSIVLGFGLHSGPILASTLRRQ